MLTINNLFIGTDIVEIERIKNSIDKYGLKFIEKIFTSREIKYCQNKENCYPHFAGRFAAKESVKKAILKLANNKSLDRVFRDSFSRKTQLICADPRMHMYLACAVIVRGPNVSVSGMQNNIEHIKSKI